jgi:hypothetical protein
VAWAERFYAIERRDLHLKLERHIAFEASDCCGGVICAYSYILQILRRNMSTTPNPALPRPPKPAAEARVVI